MEVKHTPGPWARIGTDFGTADCAIASMLVMSVVTMKRDEREENARLIAAAPELLEALQMLLEFPNTGPATSAARAAIAKATGQ